ncbi:hypothetical protein AAC387_Pa06g2145 [Persea americana]
MAQKIPLPDGFFKEWGHFCERQGLGSISCQCFLREGRFYVHSKERKGKESFSKLTPRRLIKANHRHACECEHPYPVRVRLFPPAASVTPSQQTEATRNARDL